jgi:tetratricopeptide (TPR) repeat protein
MSYSRLKLVFLASIFLVSTNLSAFSLPLLAKMSVSEADSLRIISLLNKAGNLKDINYKEAREVAISALEEARKIDSNYLLQKALSINALLDWYNGEHEQGLKKAYEGLSLAKDLKDSAAIASRYSQIGLIHLYTADYDSSLKYHEKSLAYYIDLKDTTEIIKIYSFISKVHIFRADYLKGKEILLSSVVYRRKFNSRDWSIVNSTFNTEFIKKYY